jgi:hypothetical protein
MSDSSLKQFGFNPSNISWQLYQVTVAGTLNLLVSQESQQQPPLLHTKCQQQEHSVIPMRYSDDDAKILSNNMYAMAWGG